MNKIDIVVYEDIERDIGRAALLRFNKLCETLEAQNIFIKRYSFTKDEEQCKENQDLWHLIFCAGADMLPATYVNGRIEKIEAYPTKKDICTWLPDARFTER